MSSTILAYGPPPLTIDAADAALDMIDFIAAAVRGVDTIDVTDIVRPIWRAHLAYWYPWLPPATQQWYANAPAILTALRIQWPLFQPWQRAQLVQQWSMELPLMLWMLDPVMAQAQLVEMSQNHAATLASMRQQAESARPMADDSMQTVAERLANRAQTTQSLIDYSNSMTNSTIDLMRAINRR